MLVLDVLSETRKKLTAAFKRIGRVSAPQAINLKVLPGKVSVKEFLSANI